MYLFGIVLLFFHIQNCYIIIFSSQVDGKGVQVVEIQLVVGV